MHPKDTTSFLLTWFMTEVIYTIKRWFSIGGLTQAGTKSNNTSNEEKRKICLYRCSNGIWQRLIVPSKTRNATSVPESWTYFSITVQVNRVTSAVECRCMPPPLFILSSPPCPVDVLLTSIADGSIGSAIMTLSHEFKVSFGRGAPKSTTWSVIFALFLMLNSSC